MSKKLQAEFISLVKKGSQSDDECLKKKISKQEMIDFLQSKFPATKPSDLQTIVNEMYRVFDTNGDGLSFDEYCLTRYGADKGAFIRDLVQKFNKDNDNVITFSELRGVVQEMEKNMANAPVFPAEFWTKEWSKKFDMDQDGTLTVDECIKGLTDVMVMGMQSGKFNAQCAE